MNRFNVGDLVFVYECSYRMRGEVIPLPEKQYPGMVNVLISKEGRFWKRHFHENQCRRRRLRKKEKRVPRVIFVNYYTDIRPEVFSSEIIAKQSSYSCANFKCTRKFIEVIE